MPPEDLTARTARRLAVAFYRYCNFSVLLFVSPVASAAINPAPLSVLASSIHSVRAKLQDI